MNKQDELFLKIWNNPYLFCKNFIKIIDKTGKEIPFVWNTPQKYLYNNLDKFNVIGKSRQGGISTWALSLMIWKAITTPQSTSVLYSHNDESTSTNFLKLKQMFNSIPNALKPPQERNNRQQILLSNGSSISCYCLGRKEKGRGSTINGFIHITELAFVDNEVAQKQLNAIEQSLASSGTLIIESTSNGQSLHSELYLKAKDKQNAYKPFFFSYPDFKEMFIDDYKNFKKIFKNLNGHYMGEEDLTDEERLLMQQDERIDYDVLCWRRAKIGNTGKEQFMQEYPLTFEESLITSSTSVFDKECIEQQRQRIRQVKLLYPTNLNNVLSPYNRVKQLQIYELPIVDHRYIISNDCSEGIGKDYHVSTVIDYETKKEVAMFRNNKIRPDLFAQVIDSLGRYYNNAYCIVELASGGHVVCDKLYNTYHYYNFHRHKTYDMKGKEIKKLGYDTNAKTKGFCVNALREMFESTVIQVNAEIVLDEMLTYEFIDGKYNAKNGYHDDTIMSLAIACEVMKTPVKFKVM